MASTTGFMTGKRALIVGLASDRSIAYGIAEAFKRLALWVLPAACALSFANYAIRFLKWQRYCRLLDIHLETGTSFLIYLSGMTL